MSERYPHLSDEAAALVDASFADRKRAIQSDIWITYTRAKEILEHMEELFEHPPINRMPNMLLVGASNNGKSHILEYFRDRHKADPNPEGDVANVPVIYVEAPGTPDFSDLCVRIFVELNAPFSTKGTLSQRMVAVKEILKRVGTRMLLIDEIQHMLTGGAVKQREFRNNIKDLGNALEISIVAAGIENARTVFSTDPQLNNRFEPEILPKWELGQELGRLLASLERKVPLKKASNLKSPELMQKIHYMSEGLIGEIHSVIKRGAIMAIQTETECITLDILDKIRWTQPSARQ